MAKIEVEYRGVLTKEKFQKLSAFLKEKWEFVNEKDRFSVIYFPRSKERLKVSKSPLDLRVRITNKKSELVLKYGRSSGNDARKEFLLRWGQGVENTSVLQAEVESTPCTGDK